MTLPGSRLPRLDPVAVRAPDDALVASDLIFDCGDGLERRNVRRLPLHVVDVERGGVRVVSAVDAPRSHLEVRYPRLYRSRPVVSDLVIPSLDRRVSDPSLVVAPPRVGVVGPLWARSARAERRAVLGRIPLGEERPITQCATPLFDWRVIPGRHTSMIPAHDRNPCKPDIFAATYEPAEEN